MKKIIFADISMKEEVNAVCYKGTGNACCEYEKPVVYPINAILSEKLTKDDDVKVVLIQTKGDEARVQKNTQIFKDELDDINKSIGAKINYVEVSADYNEAKENHEKRIMAILGQLEQGAELYGDITFGPRTVPMVMLCAFSFAEKFYEADIKKIVYGKVDWETNKQTGKNEPHNPELYDITSLHYLNELTYNMQSDSAEKAMKALKVFFSL